MASSYSNNLSYQSDETHQYRSLSFAGSIQQFDQNSQRMVGKSSGIGRQPPSGNPLDSGVSEANFWANMQGGPIVEQPFYPAGINKMTNDALPLVLSLAGQPLVSAPNIKVFIVYDPDNVGSKVNLRY